MSKKGFLTRQSLALGITVALSVSFCVSAPALASDSASPAKPVVVPTNAISSPHADGRDFVASFFLGAGSMTDELSEIPSLSGLTELYEAEKSPEQQEAIEQILDQVDAANPGLYERVSEEIRSGDPYQVEAAINETSDAINAQVAELADEVSEEEIEDAAISPQLVVVVVVVFHAGALVTGVVVAAVGAAVVAGAVLWTNGKSANVSQANREAMISDLTATLN